MKLYLMLAALWSVAAFALSIQAADPSKYRDFQLGMPLADVAKDSGRAQSTVKVISSRPERITEPDWRIGWTPSSSDTARVPFSGIVFAFYNNALYYISVSYDRDQTRGLTDGDIVESISSIYGSAAPVSGTKTPDTIAQRKNVDALLNPVRLPCSAGFGFGVSSKATLALAEPAILESARIDRIEAPRIEAAFQAQRLADAQLDDEKSRLVNKPGFRP
jgi:hypothetical protein